MAAAIRDRAALESGLSDRIGKLEQRLQAIRWYWYRRVGYAGTDAGTDAGYAGTYAGTGTDAGYAGTRRASSRPSVSATGTSSPYLPTLLLVLTQRMILPGSYGMCGTEVGYGATRRLEAEARIRELQAVIDKLTEQSSIGLRAYYAVSGTDIAYGSIGLRACYAVSGTDIERIVVRPGGMLKQRNQNLQVPPTAVNN
eukprot:2489095-Rhodomonas_salina.1